MIEVEAPDGTIVEFPDGTPDDVMSKAMRQAFGGPQTPAAPTQDASIPQSTAVPKIAPTLMDRLAGYGETAAGAASTAMGVGRQAVRGVGRGAAGLAGLPVDLATGVLNVGLRAAGASPIERPVFGSDYNKRTVDMALDADNALTNLIPGVERPAPSAGPQNIGERVAGRIGEEVGAMSLPVGAAIRAGQVMTRPAIEKLPTIARMFVEPASINAARFGQRELTGAVAAGVGAAGVNEVTRGAGVKEGSVGQLAGDFAGALGGMGALGVARTVGPKVLDVINAARRQPNFVNQVSKDKAVETIADAYGLDTRSGAPVDTAPMAEAIDSGRRISDTIPGYRESLADRTGSTGLAQLEYSRQAAGSGAFAQRNRENVQAVDNAVQSLAPDGQPGLFREAMSERRSGLQQAAATDAASAQARFDEAAARLQSVMQSDGRGAAIRAALDDAKAAARVVEEAAWRDASGGEANIRPLADSFKDITGKLSVAERERLAPAHLTGIPKRFLPAEEVAEAAPEATNAGLASLTDEERAMAERLLRPAPPAPSATPEVPAAATPDEPVSVALKEITGLRSALASEQRVAASNSDPARARIAGQYIDAIDAYLDGFATNADALARARDVSRDLNDRFTRPTTAVGQVLDRNQGLPRVPDSDVAQRFVQPDSGNVDDYMRLVRETGKEPNTRMALADELRDRLSKARSPEQIDMVARDHSRVMKDFPEVQAQATEASQSGSAARAANARREDLESSLGTPTRPGTSSVGRYLRYEDSAAETAMRGVIDGPQPAKDIDDLLNFAGNTPEAIEGAKATAWKIIEKRGRSRGETTATPDGTQPWKGAALKRTLDDPRFSAVLDRLYRDNPEHLDSLRKIADELQFTNTRQRARAPGSSGTAQGMSQVLSPETLQSRYYAYTRGQVSGNFLITSIAAVWARRSIANAQGAAINRLVDEALTNPEVAKVLLSENNPRNRAILGRVAKGWMGNEASTVVRLLDQDDEDPTMGALRRAGDGR